MDDSPTGKRIPVKYIGWGIADFVENTIYLHKNLRLPPWRRLRKKIIAHERAHQPGPYGFTDWKNDTKKASYDLDALIFFSQNPTAWAQLFPFRTYGRGKIYFDRQIITIYLVMFITATIAWMIF